MLAIVRRCDADGVAFPGYGTIAGDTRVSRSKVIETIPELEARGLLKVERQTRGAGKGSNRYTLPPEPPPSALGGLRRTPPRARTSAPGGLGSAPGGLGVVRQADGGSAPGGPYLLRDLPNVTAQGSAGLAPLTAPATPSPALELTVQDPPTKKTATEKPPRKTLQAKSWRKVPADWEPKERHEQRAAELRVDLAMAVDSFRHHTFDRAKTNADDTFDNWLEREPRLSKTNRWNGRARPQESDPSAVQAVLARYTNNQEN